MSLTAKALFIAPAALFGLLVPNTASAQSFAHIDRLATQLERQAKSAHDEVHAHFRFNPHYRHLDRDITEIERLASHIHDLVHRGGSLSHLRRDVRSLDTQVHHAQDVLRRMARFGAIDRRAYQHIGQELRRMEQTVHHLDEDLDHLDHHAHRHH